MCLQEMSTWASLVGLPFLLEGVERVLFSEPSLFRAENRMLYSVHCILLLPLSTGYSSQACSWLNFQLMRTYKLSCPRSMPLYTWNGVNFCAMACAVRPGVFRLLLGRPTAFERAQVSCKLSHTHTHTHTHEVDVNFWVSIRHRRFIPRPSG